MLTAPYANRRLTPTPTPTEMTRVTPGVIPNDQPFRRSVQLLELSETARSNSTLGKPQRNPIGLTEMTFRSLSIQPSVGHSPLNIAALSIFCMGQSPTLYSVMDNMTRTT